MIFHTPPRDYSIYFILVKYTRPHTYVYAQKKVSLPFSHQGEKLQRRSPIYNLQEKLLAKVGERLASWCPEKVSCAPCHAKYIARWHPKVQQLDTHRPTAMQKWLLLSAQQSAATTGGSSKTVAQTRLGQSSPAGSIEPLATRHEKSECA